jgi:hypothetical protein
MLNSKLEQEKLFFGVFDNFYEDDHVNELL